MGIFKMSFCSTVKYKKTCFALAIFLFVAQTLSADSVPALPEGLGDQDQSSPSGEPQLPAGLAGTQEDKTPAGPNLPEGLDTKSTKDNQQTFDSGSEFITITGFLETRLGYRLQNDKYQKDASIGETRLQLEMQKRWQDITFLVTSDFYYDWVHENHSVDLETGQGFLDLRQASASFTPLDFMDVKVGRQILTWGTGDLVFINDLFPKDWQSFFIGRDTEYLKAPSDAVKTSFFTSLFNIDFVYTPRFDSDRFVNGQRLSYWNGSRIAGSDSIVRTDKPDNWFDNDEFALRVSKNVSGYELAVYGYWGYWKSPAGFDTSRSLYTFPGLNVYGFSLRGQVGKGIGNIEVGYYDSTDDRSGDDSSIDNSQMRYLVGYEQDLPEIADDFTVGIQYYVEQILDYDDYIRTLTSGTNSADEYRHLITLRLTKLYWNQNLTCSLFTYYSPSDEDIYMRPNINYKISDNLAIEAGANVFFGDDPYTFFGQFQDNTNIYTAVRYSF